MNKSTIINEDLISVLLRTELNTVYCATILPNHCR